MTVALSEIGCVSDDELVRRVKLLVKSDHVLSAKLIAHLGEMHVRRLHVGLGYSSMYEYCRSALGMSDDEAYLRLKVAEVGRRFPLVLERLASGKVNLTGIKLLAKHLTDENHAELLERVQGKAKREIELLSVELEPKPDVLPRLRRLPAPRVAPDAVPAPRSPEVPLVAAASSKTFVLESPRVRAATTPLSPGRFKLEVTLGEEAHSKLEQLREMMRHQNPTGDLARIVERAISELLEREMKRRFAKTEAPKRRVSAHASSSRKSRYIPREVVREVHARDAGQCTFVSDDGHRCTERGLLEFHHHDVTFARGGGHTPDNVRLACRAHNLFFAERDYGREFMERRLRAAKGRSRSGTESTVIRSEQLFLHAHDEQLGR